MQARVEPDLIGSAPRSKARLWMFLATILLVGTTGTSAFAEDNSPPGNPEETPEFAQPFERGAKAMRNALEGMFGELEALVDALPRFERPQVLPDGTIVIPRAPDSKRGLNANPSDQADI